MLRAAGYRDLFISDCWLTWVYFQVLCASVIIAASSIIWDYMTTKTKQVIMLNSIYPSTIQPDFELDFLKMYFCGLYQNFSIMYANICAKNIQIFIIIKVFIPIAQWRLYEVKQHKYKLVLGWVTICWVVLLIRRQKACYDHNINQEPNAGGDS